MIRATVFLILSCVIFSGCNRPDLVSAWRDHPIVINGKYTDFGNATAYYDEKEKVTLSLYNDNEFLYICLISRNRRMENQLLESGLMVWFDPEAGKNKGFGIRFPVGMQAMGMPLMEPGSAARARPESEEEAAAEDEKTRVKARMRERELEKRLEALVDLQEELEIITGPGKESRVKLSLEEAAKQGIEAKTGRENGYFVYGLKVPLVKNSKYQYAIAAKEGKPIGFGIEMAPMVEIEMPGEEPDKPGMHTDGMVAEGFRLWTTITLAQSNNQ
ncbi:MAG: hypothetical protein WC532_05470 [Candidatus Omnitrophota bacterium]